jgi:hypothetical protein
LHADNSMNVMPGERTRQFARYIFIKENLQGRA